MIKSFIVLFSFISSLIPISIQHSFSIVLQNCKQSSLNARNLNFKKKILATSCSRKMAAISDLTFGSHIAGKKRMQSERSIGVNAVMQVRAFDGSFEGKALARTAIHVSAEVTSHMVFPNSPISRAVTSAAIQESAQTIIEQMSSRE